MPAGLVSRISLSPPEFSLYLLAFKTETEEK
jgi:hypothetical protein